MKVHILNRKQFEHLLTSRYDNFISVESDNNNAYISIHNYDEKELLPSNYTNYMNYWFDDVTDNDIKYCPSCFLFDEGQAEMVLDFCEANKDKKNIYVHCHAGISRSGAVGLWINDHYGKDTFQDFYTRHFWIDPNNYVTMILNRVMRKFKQGERKPTLDSE